MTVRAPDVCQTCNGGGTVTYMIDGRTEWGICEGCRCGTCGTYTLLAPECTPCAIRADADERRRADV